ncbi:MAG: capsid protein [Cressdnaviricota sp.]|nr:MAG: capsid protein [Cressdnaviricota sp.]
MAYGFKSRRKSAPSSYRRRTYGSGSYSKKFGSVRKANRGRMKRFTPKFATVGFARDVEKKYRDRAMTISGWSSDTTGLGASATAAGTGGYSWHSQGWAKYEYAGVSGSALAPCSNDLLKYVGNGANVDERVGNRIRGNYLKGAITVTAARLTGPSIGATNGDQSGESTATAANATLVQQYLRTTWRIVMVKDLQVNSVDPWIGWAAVFQNSSVSTGGLAPIGEMGGIHSELNIANMGRFRVLSDRLVEVDAKCPQKTIRHLIGSKSIGSIRYNASGYSALTDSGIYVIAAAFVDGTSVGLGAADGLFDPQLNMHNRLCFTDA